MEPILLASDHNDEVRMFIQHYNDHETETGHHLISAYIRPILRLSAQLLSYGTWECCLNAGF